MPYQAGQGTDVAARLFAEQLGKALGQQVFVDNKPGAGGNIGTEAAAQSPADGYTLLMGTVATQTMNEFLYPSTGYDSEKDFAPIILVGMLPMVISANPVVSGQHHPRADRRRQGAARQDQHRAAQHDGAHRLRAAQGAHRRAAVRRALQGLRDGDDRDDGRPGAADHRHRDRHARPCPGRQAEGAGDHDAEVERAAARREVGRRAGRRRLRGHGLERDVRAARHAEGRSSTGSNAEVAKILAQPETRQRLLQLGFEPAGGTPEQLAAFEKQERAKWGPLIKAAGLKGD